MNIFRGSGKHSQIRQLFAGQHRAIGTLNDHAVSGIDNDPPAVDENFGSDVFRQPVFVEAQQTSALQPTAIHQIDESVYSSAANSQRRIVIQSVSGVAVVMQGVPGIRQAHGAVSRPIQNGFDFFVCHCSGRYDGVGKAAQMPARGNFPAGRIEQMQNRQNQLRLCRQIDVVAAQ